MFGWDYPPGVTGNEPQITGIYPCVECGRPLAEDDPCPSCGGELEWRDRECDWFCEPCNKTFDGNMCVGGCREESV